MKARPIHLTICLIVTLIGLQSCIKSDNSTVALPLEEQEGDIPYAVIPTEIRKELKEHMNLYKGKNPPSVIGEYVISPEVAKYCSDEGGYSKGTEVTPTYFAFVENRGKISYYEKEGSTEGSSDDVSIVGSGDNFTASFISESWSDKDYDGKEETYTKTSVLISGTKTTEGIKNCEYAFVMLEKKDPLNIIMEVNGFRIFEDKDGLASNSSWRSVRSAIDESGIMFKYKDEKFNK